jgi:bifunctional non-homologous end joining protein LigD
MRSTDSPCLPTSGKVVPATSHWLHEIKYDGYRLIIQRNGSRVHLFSRNGHDWSARYHWIVERALKNRHTPFVIDGEAVILGVDGIADFNALHSRQHEDKVQLYAFDILALDGEDLRRLPLSMRKTNLAQLLRGSSKARSAPTCLGPRATWGLRTWCRSGLTDPTAPIDRRIGSR